MYAQTFQRPRSFYGQFDRKPGDKNTTHYCPGCGHGNIHKMIAEAIDDFGVQDKTVFVSPVGCSVFAYYYFDVGNLQVAHGRAPAAATAVKRALPDSLVISYQGDGDLAAIGGNEILHAANRGEDFTVIFVNNAIYGMTGGQMAPTTYIGMKTTTSPTGRVAGNDGFPVRVSELLASLEGPTYIERVALFDNKTRAKARKAIRKALQNQIEGRGFSLVEVLSPCPTGWGVTPVESLQWIQDHLLPIFPLGVLKDKSAEREHRTHRRLPITAEEIPEIVGVRSAGISAGGSRAYGPPNGFKPAADQRLKIAGFGGQGLLFLGRLLAETGMRQGLHVSWLPSYGPEMRGGTANCHVNISSTEIGSPLVSVPTVLIAMNNPSLDKFETEVDAGGLIIYDSSLIDHAPARSDVESLALPATEMADKLGSAKSANMVALGALIGRTDLLDKEAVIGAMRAMTKKAELLDINVKAIEAGFQFAREQAVDAGLWGV
jgi:2-oxoisovalerate ferredoxin oxidoreductase beta subunit